MAYIDEVIADAPSLFLKLDDVAAPVLDSSGHAHTQLLAPTLTYGQGGISTEITTSMLFSSGSIDEDFGSTDTYYGVTIELWYKSTTGTGALATSRGTSGGGFTLYMGATGAGFGAAGNISFGYDGASVYKGVCTTSTFHDGKWHHIVAVFTRASGTIAPSDFLIYVDGLVQTTTSYSIGTSPGVPITPSRNWIVGKHPAGWANASLTSTNLAMFALYPSALTQTRISAHRAAAAIPPSPVSVATVYTDALTKGPGTVSVAAVYSDMLFTTVSDVRVAAVYADILYTNISDVRMVAAYGEVLIRTPRPLKGWGIKQ